MNDNRYVLSDEERADLANSVFDGAAELDRLIPYWFTLINFQTLDMTDGGKCILGQLYGRYSNGLKALRWTDEVASKMGIFILEAGMPDNEWIAKYGELQECWVGQVADRLVDSLLGRL